MESNLLCREQNFNYNILDKKHGLPSEKSKNPSHIDATQEACSKHSNFINGFSELPIASMLTKLKSRATGVFSFSSRKM